MTIRGGSDSGRDVLHSLSPRVFIDRRIALMFNGTHSLNLLVSMGIEGTFVLTFRGKGIGSWPLDFLGSGVCILSWHLMPF